MLLQGVFRVSVNLGLTLGHICNVVLRVVFYNYSKNYI